MSPLPRIVCAVGVLASLALNSAHAVECADPALTRAITQAMGRSPKAGECNPKLYAEARTDKERIDVVRKTLGALHERNGTDALASQKLPLKSDRIH